MIQVSELHFTTEDGIKVLDGVHLRVDRGELAYLSGEASAGKSLLIGLLAGHVQPQRGQILVCNRNVARLSREKALKLRRQIGVLPQGFLPMPRSSFDNLVFKLRAVGDFREQAEEKAREALETVGLLRQQATEAGELSALERFRLGIALSICDEPLLLLVDDLFDGLGTEDQEQVCGLLERINERGMTILATLRGPVLGASRGQRVLRLVDGRMMEG